MRARFMWVWVCLFVMGCGDGGDSESMNDGGPRDSSVSGDGALIAHDAGTTTIGTLITSALYEEMFPNRNALYTYEAFIAAAAYFPAFGAEGTAEQRKREIAAFLGNASHETTGGWPTAPGGAHAWGLHFTQEVGCEGGACTGYCQASTEYPCVPGKTYHGRGPIQLSYNYNYGPFGAVLGVDLLADPDALTRDGVLAFRSALWFWMTPQAPKPSAHAVMTGQWTPTAGDVTAGRQPGFGMTVNIINGGLECGIADDSRVLDRIGFFTRYAGIFGVSVGSNIDCENMDSY
jgi:basic endochitinase B